MTVTQAVKIDNVLAQFERKCAEVAQKYQTELTTLCKSHRRERYIDWFNFGEDEPVDALIAEECMLRGCEPDEMVESERTIIGQHFDRLDDDEIAAFEKMVRQESPEFYYDDHFYSDELITLRGEWGDEIRKLKSLEYEYKNQTFVIRAKHSPSSLCCDACGNLAHSHDETGRLIAGVGLWPLSTGEMGTYIVCEGCQEKPDETHKALSRLFAECEAYDKAREEALELLGSKLSERPLHELLSPDEHAELQKFADEYKSMRIASIMQAYDDALDDDATGDTTGSQSSPIGNGATAGAAHGSQSSQATMNQFTYDPSDIRNTDVGNARRLVQMYGDRIRYVGKGFEQWFIWDGKRWAADECKQIESLAKDAVKSIFMEAATLTGDDRKTLWKWGITSEKDGNIKAMVRSAQSEPGIDVPYSKLDDATWLLNVRNGTIDLRTGQLLPHDPDKLITKYIDIDYVPNAQCPLWREFLRRIQNGDQETIEFIQRAVGYTLSGTSKEKIWLFMFGAQGDNGKSTFVEILMALMDDYSVKLPMQTLLQTNFESSRVRNDLADIAGARLVVTSEIEKGRRLNESLVKDLTGGDTISGNHLYKRSIRFRPSHALWTYGNYKPVIRGTDDAIWGRVRLIPFEVKIPKDEIDTSFPDKLKAELPGILAWAVEGCLKWQQDGLKPSQAVLGGTAQYRGDMDIIGRFLQDRCILGDDPATGKPYEVGIGLLYSEYQNWCNTEDEDELSKPKFGKELTARGFVSFPGAGNMAMRRGLTLQSTMAAQP